MSRRMQHSAAVRRLRRAVALAERYLEQAEEAESTVYRKVSRAYHISSCVRRVGSARVDLAVARLFLEAVK